VVRMTQRVVSGDPAGNVVPAEGGLKTATTLSVRQQDGF
ncbi:unnamed protein product, partial [marine sediment metagenome]